MRVIQVGGYPPPYGGTSIHNQRLHEYCREAGIETLLIDPYGRARDMTRPADVIPLTGPLPTRLAAFRRLMRARPPSLVHYHVSAFRQFVWVAPLMQWASARHVNLLSIQSGSFPAQYEAGSALRRWLTRSIVRRFAWVNVTNEAHKAFLAEQLGVPADRVSVIPSFIPAQPASAAEAAEVLAALRALRLSTDAVLLATGSLTLTYGLDLALAAAYMAEQGTGQRLGVILALYDTARSDPVVLEWTRALSSERVLTWQDLPPALFNRLLQEVDLFLRPTTTDGDSNALREAIYWGRQCIASDAAPRPDGVVLFPSGDTDALAEAIVRCLEDRSLGVAPERMADNGGRFLALYRALWAEAYRPEA